MDILNILVTVNFIFYCDGVSDDYQVAEMHKTNFGKEINHEDKESRRYYYDTTEENNGSLPLFGYTLPPIGNQSHVKGNEKNNSTEDNQGRKDADLQTRNEHLNITKIVQGNEEENLRKVTARSTTIKKSNDCEDDCEYQYYDYDNVMTKAVTTTTTTPIKRNTTYYDFYNIRPLVPTIANNENTSKRPHKVWYVAQNIPCWSMPVLYAESKSRNISHVFLIQRPKLKNVKFANNGKSHDHHSVYKKFNFKPDPGETSNFWCKSSPCFGDHTLCMYEHLKYSQLCQPGYTTRAPSFTQSLIIVDVINSMRNRIATGKSWRYSHLPTAANMHQVTYDTGLQRISEVWLKQCLPGPPLCSSQEGENAIQLECTKYADRCCLGDFEDTANCVPKSECHIESVLGCVFLWYTKAGKSLTTRDINCGVVEPLTYITAQLFYGPMNKVGCAVGISPSGHERVICHFSPGPAFTITSEYYCGFVQTIRTSTKFNDPKALPEDITGTGFLEETGINMTELEQKIIRMDNYSPTDEPIVTYHKLLDYHKSRALRNRISEIHDDKYWVLSVIRKLYDEYFYRNMTNNFNETICPIARLVVKYTFKSFIQTKCDRSTPIYKIGPPAGDCPGQGKRYEGLCYDYIDQSLEYRYVAVLAPLALFVLILYDLFNGVVRQTIY